MTKKQTDSPMKVPLSVLVPTRNEQENIQKCLESLAWADEVWVVDSNSRDRTVEIARERGARVANFSWDGRGLRKYNWSLRNIPWKHEWLLIVDADEEVSPELRDEIAATLRNPTPHAGFLIRFHYCFLGRLLKHSDPFWRLSLFRHQLAHLENRDVPEITAQMDVELHSFALVQGTVGRLRAPMIHRDLADLHHHFDRHNVYSDGEALLRTRYRDQHQDKQVRPRLFGTLMERRRFFKRLFLALPAKPWVYFAYSYFLRRGFLDGRPGFIYNVLKSFYWYQISVKEYEIKRKESSRQEVRPAEPRPNERDAQMQFYRESIDPEEEIARPRCYPRPVQFLLDFKLRTAWQWLNGDACGSQASSARAASNGQEKILVVCCGSGMESEMVARTGRHVIGLDLSLEAVRRAQERARRYRVEYDLVVGDAENLPFRTGGAEVAFVHDGLHHLPDAYRGVREMLRVAKHAVVIAEPADAALTRLAVRLGISGEYEEAGNYVYRLRQEKLTEVFREYGCQSWRFQRNLIYYQPWTFRLYRLFEKPPLFWLFRAGFYFFNLLLGRWGNSLRAVAWKAAPSGREEFR